jgi:hypothetical protein
MQSHRHSRITEDEEHRNQRMRGGGLLPSGHALVVYARKLVVPRRGIRACFRLALRTSEVRTHAQICVVRNPVSCSLGSSRISRAVALAAVTRMARTGWGRSRVAQHTLQWTDQCTVFRFVTVKPRKGK